LLKVLIDENLSPSLAADAQQKGFLCSHVNHLGKTGTKDWELKRVILEGDWTFVTNNSTDFRGPANEPGSPGEYEDVRLHAGLVCIDASIWLEPGPAAADF
jgi:predicted nuclease of predicted toxin-antitoxin system